MRKSAQKCSSAIEKCECESAKMAKNPTYAFVRFFLATFLRFFATFAFPYSPVFFPNAHFLAPKVRKTVDLAPEDRIILQVGTFPMEYVNQLNLVLYNTCLCASSELLPPYGHPAKGQTNPGI